MNSAKSANLRLCLFSVALAVGLIFNAHLELFAATLPKMDPALDQQKTILGSFNSPIAMVQTPTGAAIMMRDEVRVESVNGCHLAYATANDPQSPKLQVTVDGQIVLGYDDVVWSSLKFSPDGNHVAFVANVGGRQVCVLDGKSGPLFDGIGEMDDNPLVFSPDGHHLGYAAKNNGKWCVVLDGVAGPEFDEVAGMGITYHYNRDLRGLPRFATEVYGSSSCPIFTPNGGHCFYLAVKRQEKDRRYTMIFDGKSGSEFDQFSGAEISPDGQHVAFTGTLNGVGQVVYDGVPQKPWTGGVGGIAFSQDSKHLAYISGEYAKGQQVVVDGSPDRTFKGIDEDGVTFSPNGQHVEYRAFLDSNSTAIVLDGKVAPPVDGLEVRQIEFTGVGNHVIYITSNDRDERILVDGKEALKILQNVFFEISPDGQHIAYASYAAGGQMQIMLDGTTGPLVDHVNPSTAKFSTDSRHFAYVADNRNGRFQVVVDGKSGPEFSWIADGYPVFSPDNNHFVYAAKLGELWQVIVDGKPGPNLYNVDLDTLQFSPDGQRLIYTGLLGYQQTVVVNTTTGPKYEEIRKGSLTLGPEGKHLAYVAKEENGKWQAVIDGVAGPEFDQIGDKNVVYSSNGKHWAYVAQKNGQQQLIVDGIAGPEFLGIAAGPIECQDGHLEYLAFEVNKDKINLVRIKVPGFGPTKA